MGGIDLVGGRRIAPKLHTNEISALAIKILNYFIGFVSKRIRNNMRLYELIRNISLVLVGIRFYDEFWFFYRYCLGLIRNGHKNHSQDGWMYRYKYLMKIPEKP